MSNNELTAQIDELERLLALKDELAEQTKENNKAIEETKKNIANMMIDAEQDKVSVHGYVYSLDVAPQYQKKGDEHFADLPLSFFDFLREENLDYLITERVDPRSLNKAIKDIVEEVGELPEQFNDYINVYEPVDVKRRKDTSKKKG